ncbi:MAG: 4-hydroxybenzoyl-CoA reductase subunit beta [Jhaorihella sp.]
MTEALPQFKIVTPESVEAAVAALAGAPDARLCAGGTDIVVALRKGLAETGTLVDLSRIAALRETTEREDGGMVIGAGVTLAALERMPQIAARYPAIARAAAAVAGPTHREVATLGGNLCLDTRCVYYNQSHWWRKSNDFCLKYRGDTCHVAPQGNRCRAAFSGDLAPALMVHDAEIEIAGPGGTRRLPLADLYNEDGAAHLTLEPGEIVVAAHLPPAPGASDYAKIRVRGAIDFPLAGVAVATRPGSEGTAFRIAVTGTNSKPLLVDFTETLAGESAADALFAAMQKAVQKAVSPQRTTTIAPHYRRLSVSALAARVARGLVGSAA